MRPYLAVSLTLLLLASAAKAEEYFVDSRTGDDSSDGLSSANAWRTIKKVNESTFSPGDRIFYSIRAIDAAGNGVSPNENIAEVTYIGPDLRIVEIGIPEALVINSLASFEIVVENQGASASPSPISLQLLIDGTVVGEAALDSIEAGDSVEIAISWFPEAEGEESLTAM